MSRETYTVQLFGGHDGHTLYPDRTAYRPNRHVEPRPWRDVLDICGVGLLALLGYCIVVLVLS